MLSVPKLLALLLDTSGYSFRMFRGQPTQPLGAGHLALCLEDSQGAQALSAVFRGQALSAIWFKPLKPKHCFTIKDGVEDIAQEASTPDIDLFETRSHP